MGRRIRILVADDQESERDAMTLALESEGFEVRTAVDGLDAVGQCMFDRPDLVVCDIFMPGKDGLQVLRELRALDPNYKIIMFSGGGTHHFMSPLVMASHLGADRTLEKPFSLEELLEAIREVVEGIRAE
jgi:DNA-binding response OmpR family regulator